MTVEKGKNINLSFIDDGKYSFQKFKIKEVPVEMHEREAGKSSINLLKSADYMIKVIIIFCGPDIAFGSTPAKGSSSNKNLGSMVNNLAISTLLLSPPDNDFPYVFLT